MKVYIISGLGTDHRVFKKLNFPKGYIPTHLKWLQPKRFESVADYACRLSANIDTTQPFILLGLSFGGLIAGEIAKIKHPLQTILLSTMTMSRQLRFVYRMAGAIRLHKILPLSLLAKGNVLTYFFFGVKISADKELLKIILSETDPTFLDWAVDALLKWKNDKPADNLYHIHGSKDRLIPLRRVTPNIVIEKGGHLMVLTMHERVSEAIAESLKPL